MESRARDLLAALALRRHPDPLLALRDALGDLTGRRVLLAPSGQAAIAQILSLLPQREVVMPAYMCYQVKRAAEIAGKRVIYVDLGKNSVNATSSEFAEAAKPGRILLAAHVWGVPADIEAICQLAKDRDCVVIEDAVPAFGGRWNGRLLGTFGDFGVFSFHYSKRLSALRGGAIIVNNDRVVDPVALEASRVVQSRRAMPIRELLLALAESLATTPWIYRNFTRPLLPLRGSLPLLWRKPHQKRAPVHAERQAAAPAGQHFTRDYTRRIHPYQAELALRVLGRFGETRERIARLATIYQKAFHDTPITTFLPPGCDNGGLIRFPVAFYGKDRAEILRLARKRGIYLKWLWGPLPDESEQAQFPNAVRVARSLVLLPLYSALSPESAELLAQSVIEIERNAPGIQPAKRSVSAAPVARSQHTEVSRQQANPRAPAFGSHQEQSSVVIED
jgi:dTDP-4-amino-4,6-dideoxygalactose transaminase